MLLLIMRWKKKKLYVLLILLLLWLKLRALYIIREEKKGESDEGKKDRDEGKWSEGIKEQTHDRNGQNMYGWGTEGVD